MSSSSIAWIASQAPEASPNLYPHTPHHRGLPPPLRTDTIVSMACSLPRWEGRIELGYEDLATLAASLLWKDRPHSPVVVAQAELIAEAYRHDLGLDLWRPGRRGITGHAVRGIARLAANDELPLLTRKAYVYKWLHGQPVPLDDWEPDPLVAVSCEHVTYIRGPLWRGWEYTPVAVNHLGEVDVHPGARWIRLRQWLLKLNPVQPGDPPEIAIKKVLAIARNSC